MYNHLLYAGIFPDHFKIAVVKPLHKKGDKTGMTNYRCISLLMFFYKILEKAMHSRLSQHMNINNILVTEQYSFRKGVSYDNDAFRLTDSVFKSINQKMIVGGIFYDLAKAFDCLKDESLLAKLHVYEI
jgi:hypothetical protein